MYVLFYFYGLISLFSDPFSALNLEPQIARGASPSLGIRSKNKVISQKYYEVLKHFSCLNG